MRLKKIHSQIKLFSRVSRCNVLTGLCRWAFIVCWLPSVSQPVYLIDSLQNQLSLTNDEANQVDIYYQLFDELKDNDSLHSVQYALKGIAIAKSNGFDSLAAGLMYDLGWSLMQWGNLTDALNQFQELITYSRANQYLKGEASGYKGLGDVNRLNAAYDLALKNYSMAVEKWIETGDKRGLGYVYNNIGVIYRNQSNIPKALAYYLKAVELLEEIQDARGIGYISSNIGNIYYQRGDYDQAATYHTKALKYNKEISDKTGVSFALNNLGLVYEDQKQFDRAMEYFKQSLAINRQSNNKEGIVLAYINIGNVHLDLGQNDSARYYFENVLAITQTNDDRQSETYALIGLGSTLIQLKEYSKAKPYLQKAIDLSQEIGYPTNTVVAAERLFEVETKLGNDKAALDAHILFKQVSDSIFNEAQTEKFVRVQAESEFQQERDSLNFAQERERLLFEAELARKNASQWSLIVGIILTTIVIIVIIFYNRRLQKLNAIVTQKRDQLDQLNKTKSRFFSIIAHDLRGPMSILIGYGDLISKEIDQHHQMLKDSELGTMFGYLKDSSKTVMELIDNLLTWAIKEENGFQIKKESLSLKKCVEKNFEIFKHQAMAKSIALVSEVHDIDWFIADRNSLMTILRNLTSNALKFTLEGGTITITGKMRGPKMIISIRDTGVGISSEKIDTLFEIDDRKVTQGTGGEKGTGLGLNLVYDFVKLNQGRITVNSVEGEGTTFMLEFPAV